MPAHKIQVSASAGGYPVLIEPGLLSDLDRVVAEFLPAHRYAVIADSTVSGLYGDVVMSAVPLGQADLVEFPAGEAHKTRETWATLSDRLIELGHGRDSAVIALGGGVTGDLAGFVAATFMRGIPVLQIPTSTVAMVDSAVGGKTGVDTESGKNLIGAFHAPRAVVVDPEVVSTLPTAQRSEGWVEAVKHGAIADADYFARLVEDAPALVAGKVAETELAVIRSVEVKASVVGDDELEGGKRMILNFGHTFGHAIEAISGYSLSHGEAVATGMLLEAEAGERMGVTEPGTSARLAEALDAIDIETGLPADCDFERVAGFLARDKKARSGTARFVLLRRIGEIDRSAGWSTEIPQEILRETLSNTRLKG